MLERIAPHLAMIGIHKNGTWAAQKIIECVQTPDEIALVAQNLRAYTPPLLLDQFGNYVVQCVNSTISPEYELILFIRCCLRFGSPSNDFIFDAIVDRLWEIAQGRFGARSVRACLESQNYVTISQQRRIATAIILNSIPLATNPNGALLLTWLLDTSNFPSRYRLLAPRFTPHLSHLCTHKLASLTVLRIVNQKVEPDASTQIVDSLFFSPADHVLTDVLGDQVNGVAVVHKILTTPFIDPAKRHAYLEATKRGLIELKVIATQAYRRLIEEVGLPVSSFAANYAAGMGQASGIKKSASQGSYYGSPTTDQNLASMMAALQMGGQSHVTPLLGGPPPQLQIDPSFGQAGGAPSNGRAMRNSAVSPSSFSPAGPGVDQFNPFAPGSPALDSTGNRNGIARRGGPPPPASAPAPVMQAPPPAMSPPPMTMAYGAQSQPMAAPAGSMMGMAAAAASPYAMQTQQLPRCESFHFGLMSVK